MQYNVEIVLKLFDQFSRALSEPLEQVKKLENQLKQVQETTANLQSPFQRLQKTIKETFDIEHIKNFSDKLDNFSSEIAKATALPIAGIGGSLVAFADLDQARANLEVAFMLNKNASTQEELKNNEKYLKEINKQVMDLGNLYPGSTKDYYEMAYALKTVGLSAETIANGALRASANLWVLVKDTEHLSTEQIADYIGKFKEAYNIEDKDFGQFIDRLQKVKFATGLRIDEIAGTSKYLAPTLNLLNLKGIEAFNTISVLYGALRKVGIAETEAGTSIKDALEHIPKLDENVEKLKKRGINFNISSKEFFENGQFQLEKFFAVLRDRLSQVKDVNQRLEIMQELFGQQGLRGVSVLVSGTKEQALEYIDTLLRMKKITEKQYKEMKDQINKGGFTGIEKVATDIQKQASVKERTERLIHTSKNTFEALQGTFINLSAAIGSLFAPALISVFTKLNNYLSRMQDVIENHRTLASTIAVIVGGSLGFLALLGIIAKVGSIFLSLSLVGFKVISMFGKLAFVIVRMVIPALNLLRMAFISNPLGLLITAIAGAIVAGYLLWKNWDKITAWFKSHFPTAFGAISAFIKGFTEGISSAFKDFTTAIQPLREAFKDFITAMQPVKEAFKQLFNAVKPIFNAIISFFAPATNSINKTSNATKHLNNSIKATADTFKIFEELGKGLAFILTIPIRLITWNITVITFFVAKIIEAIKTISSINLFEAGKKILTTLTDGIKSVANKPIEIMKNIVQKIRNLLPFSPAKEGPLRDLHRIKLIETIADTIRPNPLTDKMSRALSLTISPIKSISLNVKTLMPKIEPVEIPARLQTAISPVKTTTIKIFKTIKTITNAVKTFKATTNAVKTFKTNTFKSNTFKTFKAVNTFKALTNTFKTFKSNTLKTITNTVKTFKAVNTFKTLTNTVKAFKTNTLKTLTNTSINTTKTFKTITNTKILKTITAPLKAVQIMKTEPAKLQTFLKTITVPITVPLKSEPVKIIITPPSNPKTSSNISVHIGNITISANTNAEISKNVATELEREIRRVLEKINRDNERRKY